MPPERSAWETAGLFDPATDPPQRLAVLEYLASLGLSVDEVADATKVRLLNELAAEKVLWGDAGPTLTLAEVAARSGAPMELAREIVRASGMPDPGDEPRFREAHVAVFEAFTLGAAFFGAEPILQFERVVATAAARVTDAAIALFTATIIPQLDSVHAEEVERVRTAAEAVRTFNVVPPAMDVLLRQQFLTSIRRFGMLDVGEGGAITVAVAFVDLVASTELALRVDVGDLTSALRAFEHAAYDIADRYDSRIVKLIGDEAMIMGPDARQVCAAVLELLAVVDDHPLLDAARAGLAVGPTVPRDGDVFGPTVHLAARLVKEADPGTALVTQAVVDAVGGSALGFVVTPAGDLALKGFDRPVPAFVVQPR